MIITPRIYFRLSPFINRQIHTTGSDYNKNITVLRQVAIMRKLLGNKESGSKKRWYPNEGTSSSSLQITSVRDIGKTRRQGKNASRRVNVLNKLFMKHITDQLATGAISEKILGKGLEISRVKVSSDFFGVNVFWTAKGNVSDNEIEYSLKKCSGILRHELSQLRIMGEVPKIYFVKDKTCANFAEVDTILKDCDFGDDFEEIKCSNQLRNELSLSNNFEEFFDYETLPIMRHDVLGLDHRKIMTGILMKMKKSKDAWNHYQAGGKEIDTLLEVENATPKLDVMEKRLKEVRLKEEGFERFLRARSFRKETPERKKPIKILERGFENYPEEEYLSRWNKDEGDYIEEVDSKKN